MPKCLLIISLHCASCYLHFRYAYIKTIQNSTIAFSLIVVISAKDSDSFLLESLETQTCVTAAQNCCCFHIFLLCYNLIKSIFSDSLVILTSLSQAFITLLTSLVEPCYYRLALSAFSTLSSWNDHRPRLTLPLLLL